MSAFLSDIVAVTFDFYNTLACHSQGRGRGAVLMEYLETQGLRSDPWEHEVLYHIFEHHESEYAPHQSEEKKQSYFEGLTNRLFRRLNIQAPPDTAVEHAGTVWNILGPASLALFPEVHDVLKTLGDAGYRLSVVSNWQCGLRHFCTELGVGGSFEHVVASAEVGYAKPHPAIFAEACRRLGLCAEQVLHVGDTVADDINGARGAGLHALLVRRNGEPSPAGVSTIPSLDPLPALLGVDCHGQALESREHTSGIR